MMLCVAITLSNSIARTSSVSARMRGSKRWIASRMLRSSMPTSMRDAS
jgi:hypothetical protein